MQELSEYKRPVSLTRKTKFILLGVGFVLGLILVVLVRVLTGEFKSIGTDLNKSAFKLATIKVDTLKKERAVLTAKADVKAEEIAAVDKELKAVDTKRVVARAKIEGKSNEEIIALLDTLGY